MAVAVGELGPSLRWATTTRTTRTTRSASQLDQRCDGAGREACQVPLRRVRAGELSSWGVSL